VFLKEGWASLEGDILVVFHYLSESKIQSDRDGLWLGWPYKRGTI
jgi:hypothetical protein